MWFRLALELGRTVAELQRSMSAAEFGEWLAFYSIEPFGQIRDELRTGRVCASLYAVNGDARRMSDFMFDPDRPSGETGLTGDALEKVLEGMAAQLGAVNG